ncbi:MAG TPA: hypothetical protein VF904_11995 [Anaeromyxobacteraceae bacterium]
MAPSRTGAEQLYLLYLARYRAILGAVRRHDTDSLRVTELEFGSLSEPEQRVVAMAVHDVAARLPRRAKPHFIRSLEVPVADGAPARERASR